jgi:uncharacterized OB-fold protein
MEPMEHRPAYALANLFTMDGDAVRLKGSHCSQCGAIAFPPRRVCGACGARQLGIRMLTGKGTVLSSTRVTTPPAGFEQPIDVGIVDLAEGPRVFALLTSRVDAGSSVQAVRAAVRDGHAGFAFGPPQ